MPFWSFESRSVVAVWSSLTLVVMQTCIWAQSLQEELDARRDRFAQRAPQALLDSQNRALQELSDSGIYERVKKVGDQAPLFTLTNHRGEEVPLSTLLKKGPVVLTWYRGGWCPYCNIALRALAAQNDHFLELGATLVALTPEHPTITDQTVQEEALPFQVLTDLDHAVAKEYGLVFDLNQETALRYEQRFHLSQRSGASAANKLPLAAAYVVSQDSVITYAFVDADYRRRAEPERILDALKALKQPPTGRHLLLQYWENVWNPPYDLNLMDRLLADDMIATQDGKELQSRQTYKAWVETVQQQATGIRFTPLECFESADGSRVVSRWSAHAQNGGILSNTPIGQNIQSTGMAIWEVREGRLTRGWSERSTWKSQDTLP